MKKMCKIVKLLLEFFAYFSKKKLNNSSQADEALYQPQNVIEKFSFPDRVQMGSYSGEKT